MEEEMNDTPFFIRKVDSKHIRLIVGDWASLPLKISTSKYDSIWDAEPESQEVKVMVRRYMRRLNAPDHIVNKIEAWYGNLEK